MSVLNESDVFTVGIVGVGLLGQAIGTQFLSRSDARVVAIADISETARSQGGDELSVPVESRYEEYEQMLDNEDIDGVVITTPHALHYEQISAAFDRELQVLCEKPLVLDVKEAVELRDRADELGLTLMVGFQRHQDLSFRKAKERYQNRGPEIEFITAEITQPWFESFGGTWRTNVGLSGGGFLVDTGRHVIDALLWVTELNPIAVTTEMTYWDDGVDDAADLYIEFDNGATASVSIYGDAPAVREEYHIWDEDGATYVEGRGWGKRTLTTIDEDGTEHSPLLNRGQEQNKADAFMNAIKTGEKPPATPIDAIRATALIDAAYKSAKADERVEIALPEGAR